MAQWIGVNATRLAWETKVETASQRLVLLAIAKYADLDGTAFPSVESLCADTCLNRKTAFKVLKELQKIGAIVVSKRQPNNGNCYSICGACPKNGSTEIGTTKNGSTEIGTGGSTKNGTPVVPKTVHEEEQEEEQEESKEEVRATQIFSAEKIARPEPDLAEEINSQLRDAVDRDPDDFDPVDAAPEALDIFDTEPLPVGGTKAAPCPVTEDRRPLQQKARALPPDRPEDDAGTSAGRPGQMAGRRRDRRKPRPRHGHGGHERLLRQDRQKQLPDGPCSWEGMARGL